MKLYLLLTFLLGLTCVRVANLATSPRMRAAGKPGLCPILRDLTLEICFARCENDFDCEGNRKCCKTSCNGHQCKIPDEKPGSCPSPENVNGIMTCDRTHDCSSDNKCEGDQKCCPNICGDRPTCQNPV